MSRKLIAFVLVCLAMSSCAKLANIPKDHLNHPAMDLTQRSTPEKSQKYTILGRKIGGPNGGCTTCAK